MQESRVARIRAETIHLRVDLERERARRSSPPRRAPARRTPPRAGRAPGAAPPCHSASTYSVHRSCSSCSRIARASSSRPLFTRQRALQGAEPGQLRRHDRSDLILRERLLEPARELQRLRVEGAAELEEGMQLDGFRADRHGLVEFPPPESHEHVGRGQQRQERVDGIRPMDRVERVVQPPERRIQHRQPDVGGAERRVLVAAPEGTRPALPAAGARTCATRGRDCSAAPASSRRALRLDRAPSGTVRTSHGARACPANRASDSRQIDPRTHGSRSHRRRPPG